MHAPVPPSSELAAQLVDRSARGYAGFAAARLLDPSAHLESEVGPETFALWKSHLEQRLGELAAAIAFGRPELFTAGVLWARTAFEARAIPVGDLVRSLDILEDVLTEKLPERHRAEVRPYLEDARRALDSTPAPGAALEPDGRADRLALRFIDAALSGDSRGAAGRLLDAVDDGLGIAELFEDVLVPAQREIGRMWHAGEINVAEEHVATAAAARVVTLLSDRMQPAAPNGKTVLAACAAGNSHDLGVRLIAGIFELDGWRTILLGSDVPTADLLQAIVGFEVDLLALSATLNSQLAELRETITAVRDQVPDDQIKILVGGRAFRAQPDLWRQVGADGWAASLRDATTEGARLVGLG